MGGVCSRLKLPKPCCHSQLISYQTRPTDRGTSLYPDSPVTVCIPKLYPSTNVTQETCTPLQSGGKGYV